MYWKSIEHLNKLYIILEVYKNKLGNRYLLCTIEETNNS